LLTEEEFADKCQSDSKLVVTYKVGTNNCFVNIKDRQNERLTAGVSLTRYKSAEDAQEEFERRVDVTKATTDQSIGEMAYEMPNPPVDRAESYFLRDDYIVKIGTDVRLCEKAGMIGVGKIVDSRLK